MAIVGLVGETDPSSFSAPATAVILYLAAGQGGGGEREEQKEGGTGGNGGRQANEDGEIGIGVNVEEVETGNKKGGGEYEERKEDRSVGVWEGGSI